MGEYVWAEKCIQPLPQHWSTNGQNLDDADYLEDLDDVDHDLSEIRTVWAQKCNQTLPYHWSRVKPR